MFVAFMIPIVMALGAMAVITLFGQNPSQRRKRAQQQSKDRYEGAIRAGRFIDHCSCPRCRRNCRRRHKKLKGFSGYPDEILKKYPVKYLSR